MRSFVSATLVACLAAGVVFADSAPQKKTEPNQPCMTKSKQPCDPLYRPVRLYESMDNNGVILGLRGDVLYMNYTTPVLSYASEEYTAPGSILNSKILNVPGRASVGCTLAAMYTMPHFPGYTVQVGWYHIVTKFSNSNTSGVLVPAHSLALNQAAPGSGSIHASLAINFFDLVLQDTFSWGKSFTFAPAAGIIGGYMNSTNHTKFTATSGSFYSGSTITLATLNQTFKFEGIGMKLGFDYSYRLWGGFKFMGNFFYNALYGFTKANLTSSINGLYASTYLGSDVSYSQHHGRNFFDTLIGFCWGGAFCSDKYFFDVHAGWRYQAFSSGWMQFEDEINDSIHDLDLCGQGLQAGVAFKF